MMELTADAPVVFNARGPMHDQRIANPAAVGILLVPLERRVSGLSPAPGDVGMAVGSADFIQPILDGVDIFRHTVEILELVHDTGGTAFLAGAVVRKQYDQGVVELPHLLQKRDQSSDLMIGVIQHPGKCFLKSQGKFLFVFRKLIPGPHPGISRCQLCVFRNNTHFDLSAVPLFANNIPAGIEAAAIFFNEFSGRLMRGMGGTEGQIKKERPIRPDGLCIADKGHGLIDDIFTDMVALIRFAGRINRVVVIGQLRVKLVGFTLQKSIKTVETALKGPVAEWPGG